ncbi:unnamed protein product, partial [Rotaria socialis]
DDNDDNQQQSQQQQYQQRIDGDYETDDINKSKLLMWGLTK